MQRSITYKNPLTPFLYAVLFFIYTALSGIHLFLPPLLAVVFMLFSRALDKQNNINLIVILFCLLAFEAQNGYALFSTIIYFTILYRYIMPKMKQNFNCATCIKIASVIFVYIGFFLFHLLLSNVFLLPIPSLNDYVIYYIIIEFLIVSIL